MFQLKVTTLVLSFVLSMVVVMILPQHVLAAAPDNAELLEEVPSPPRVQEGEPLDEPVITIRKKGTDTIEEYRLHGELYMMKVTPEHGVPYYLHREDAGSDWVDIGPNPPLSVPKWILFRF